MSYDSKKDTENHIERVQELLCNITNQITFRGKQHDASKMCEPEKPIFDTVTTKLCGMTYGSEEYKASLAEIKPALDHHYSHNRHHPEHFQPEADATFKASPITCMTLIDLMEMLADWKAAGERHFDGNLEHSFEVNSKRFNIPDSLMGVLRNTAKDLGWM